MKNPLFGMCVAVQGKKISFLNGLTINILTLGFTGAPDNYYKRC